MSSQIFVIIAKTGAPEIRTRIKTLADEGGFYSITDDSWFMTYDGTSQELAEKLGIRDGSNGTGVVTPISNYSGRGPTDLWEWLKVHWPRDIPR